MAPKYKLGRLSSMWEADSDRDYAEQFMVQDDEDSEPRPPLTPEEESGE